MTEHKTDILIIGGGPTGLGAATRLHEKGADWHLIEADREFGGLACSFVDDKGFTWDLGGHVQFSHYDTFDRYMKLALGEDGWLTHQRESWVWIRNRWVPYPFQNNLHRLDPVDRWAALEGLLQAGEAAAKPGAPRPANFLEWMVATFGQGITDLFMRPYNFKVWAWPVETMDFGWIGERVAVPALKGVLKSVCTGEDAVSWGPNAVFQFPKRGGTGAIWRAVGRMLPPERVTLGVPVTGIDAKGKFLRTENGDVWRYNHLISTIPLNHLIRMAPGVVDAGLADRLVYSATNVVGVGLSGQPPEHLKTKCWMYFPEANSPYYRVTVFSNYSPENVPVPGAQWSLMTETAESDAKPVDVAGLADDTVRALREDGMIPEGTEILSVTHRRLAQGYPTPFLGRDALVDPALRAFEVAKIFSRGRFGAWKYEVANQDHSFAQGYECAERLLARGGPEHEPTLHTPSVVNARRNP